MPLVTLTCSRQYYPPDEPVSHRMNIPSPQQTEIIALATQLPGMMLNCKHQLKLGNTPAEAVQVDIKRFHTYAINTVDLWVHIWFTEPSEHFGSAGRDMVRDTLAGLISVWAKENELKLSWALDVFFGPGTGCFTNAKGEIQQIW
jgi:hypothetical protein